MKISFIIPTLPPNYAGGSLRLFRQAQYFSKENETEVITCTTGYEKKKGYVFIQKIYLKGNNVLSKSINKLFSFFLIFIHYVFNRPDVIHLINSKSTFSPQTVFAAKILRIRLLNSCTLYGSDDPLTITASSLLKYIYFEMPSAVVSNSPQLYEVCNKTINRKGSTYMIPNPVDTDFFKKPIVEKTSNIIKLLTVSVVNERKNVLGLVKVVEGTLNRFENIVLTVVGPHSRNAGEINYFAELNDYIEQNGLVEKIRFVGKVEDVRSYYFDSDLFLFYSTSEGMPNVILESLSCSLPVVCKEIKGVTDYMLEDGGGFSTKSDEEFRTSLDRLIESKELRESTSKNARKNILNNFSRTMIYDKYFELYKTL